MNQNSPSLSLSFVLPAYNPPGGWSLRTIEVIEQIKLDFKEMACQLIIVNDGSSKWLADDITNILEKYPETLVLKHSINYGKGQALRTGVSQATGDIIIITDIDWPYTYKSVADIITAIRNGNDAALGHRDENYYKNMPDARRRISRILRGLNKQLLNLVTDDTQCGLKGMSLAAKAVFLETSIPRYLFDLEFVKLLSNRNDLKIVIVPVTLREGVVFTKMRFTVLRREAFNFLNILWKKRK